MKIRLRTTLLTILLALICLTLLALIASSSHYSRRSANELLARILQETSQNIYDRIGQLIDTASDQGNLDQVLLNNGAFRANDFSWLNLYWGQVMQMHPELSAISITLEETGELFRVNRSHDGKLFVEQLRENAATHTLKSSGYEWQDLLQAESGEEDELDLSDPRHRPWYTRARDAGRQVWLESSTLPGRTRRPDVACVTCATPVLREDGSLIGVLTAEFDVFELSEFLTKLQVGTTGFAFIVEVRDDGTRPVIALPNRKAAARDVGRSDSGTPPKNVADSHYGEACIREFMQMVPGQIDRGQDARFMQVSFDANDLRYVGGYCYVKGTDTPEWIVCILLPESEVMYHVWRNNRLSILIGVGVLVVAAFVSMHVSRQVARPLEELGAETKAISRFHVDARPTIRSIVREVDQLAVAVEEMKTGLRSFQKYVPTELVRSVLESNQEATLGGERREVTVFFSDIVNFTGISENLPPEQLVHQLGEYLDALSHEITETGGTVDKYIGDSIMAFWGAPAPNPLQAVCACRAALRCQAVLRQLRTQWKDAGKTPYFNRIGLSSGEVLVGNIGSQARINYTVIGDTVNLASRLEGLNKFYGTEIIVSEATYQSAKSEVVARPLDWVSVKGKGQAVLVYQLLGFRGDGDSQFETLEELAALAMASYRQQDWKAAIERSEQILRFRPQDKPARQMIVRCRSYQVQPPDPTWDGVNRLETK